MPIPVANEMDFSDDDGLSSPFGQVATAGKGDQRLLPVRKILQSLYRWLVRLQVGQSRPSFSHKLLANWPQLRQSHQNMCVSLCRKSHESP